ncbi:hypothetical protein GH714_034727 [Hevea brasiliensis]|uniref:DUF632 domain-containing protein n=1 Tax=Hevea brasiliensis TaxID=3981 RepID=A0A6A6MGQ5_HEVBR|nr:hypothetical protein GH714_034727 [Hevea brasiliensis]
MGCGLSKQDEEDHIVSLCRERKRLIKLTVERRYAFADAQLKYNQSLYAVAMALRLFVARHSSPSSPFLITFPSATSANVDTNETLPDNPNFLQQRPTETTHENNACQPSDSNVSIAPSKLETEVEETQEDNNDHGHHEEQESEEEDHESESEEGEGLCEHFYGEDGPPVPSPQREFGWDFFYPFDEMRSEVLNGFGQTSDEDLRAVREKEGIPELEEDGEKVMNEGEASNVENGDVGHKENGIIDVRSGDNAYVVGQGESTGLRVIDEPKNGRELLEALKNIEDHFFRAYDSGLDISRMLEANRVQLQSGLEEIKESSNKLIRSITWNRSASFRSSSCKSLLTSSSISSSMWTEFKTDLFDDYGLEAGSHSTTLERLCLGEEALPGGEAKYPSFIAVDVNSFISLVTAYQIPLKCYNDGCAQAGDQTRKIYERKCSHLRHPDATGDDFCSMDKSTTEVKELYSRISVAIRSVESISDRIQKLRDEELQQQLLELLHGLMRNWKIMLESHETQNRVMLEVKFFNCPAYGKFCNDSHRLATLQLEAELDNWSACFAAYVSTQKAYIEALGGWLSKFIAPEVEFYSRGKSSLPPCRVNGPPLLVTCHDWLAWLENLPDTAVTFAMKSFAKDIHALWNQQGKEQQQKRNVDTIAKEFERRALAFQRAERGSLDPRYLSRNHWSLSVIALSAWQKGKNYWICSGKG